MSRRSSTLLLVSYRQLVSDGLDAYHELVAPQMHLKVSEVWNHFFVQYVSVQISLCAVNKTSGCPYKTAAGITINVL